MDANPFEVLDQVPANHVPLTPLSFLERGATVFPQKIAVIHGDKQFTYREFRERCHRLARALAANGISQGDAVSVMAPNVPAMLEAHYGVPMCGAVLNALNYRLDAPTIAHIMNHAGTKLLITDREFSPVISKALELVDNAPIVIDIDDPLAESGELIGSMDYESFIAQADMNLELPKLANEWQSITLNYTSGTTGNPKGVVYHHRGAYLNALGQILSFGINAQSRYLWTLPMFHCNGWTYTWAITAAAGTHVCLRKVDPALIFPMIRDLGITHMCGAPIVLTMLLHAPDKVKTRFEQTVEVVTGGAAPPSAVIAGMEKMGFKITHMYGLTESYGPATVCVAQDDWAELKPDERALRMALQGVALTTLEEVKVADPLTLEECPRDGTTMGELMLRGNTVMKGYLKNPSATDEAFAGGWYHTGDLGVRHPDGYVEIKDRAKDIIISGGENVSSLEVEEALYQHPNIMEAAVVAKPDERWGETVCAFVTLKPGCESMSEATLIEWCRDHMAHFKVPKTIVFGGLPKTSTGKIQKFVLRDQTGEI